MSLASMIAKQVVKATGDMFKDVDIQKAISTQVDEVVSANNLDSKEGQDYLLRMTKAMVTDDPNFKVNKDLDPNLGMYLEVENKIFSGNPGVRDAYHAAKINNAGLQGKTRDFSDATLRPYEAVTAPATYDEMFDSLHAGKREKINEPIADGSEVAIRLDIPAYLEKNTWVPTIHFGNKTSHRATVALKNADFAPSKGNEEQAFRIKIGSEVKKEIDKLAKEGRLRTGFRSGDLEKGDLIDANTKEGKKQIDKIKAAYNKTNFSRIKGSLINRTDEENYRLAQEALNDPEWTQIGYNPDRHSYYFDRVTGDPIIGGDEAIQVGHLVLVKNAVRSDRRDFKYAEGGAVTRTIKRGDTLSKISKETGVSISDLVKLNNIENPDLIRAGDTLILTDAPKKQSSIRRAATRRTKEKPVEEEKSSFTFIPTNAKAFTKFLLGNFLGLSTEGRDIDVSTLGEEQQTVLKNAMVNARKDGRDYVTYKDYPKMEDGQAVNDFYRQKRSETNIFDLAKASFTDPVFEMFTSLGAFNFREMSSGEFEVLPDRYDFDKSKSTVQDRANPKDDYSKLTYLGQDISEDENAYGFNFKGRIDVAKGGKIDKKKMACNKPRRTPSHPKKSHVVKACKDGKEKIIRFGEQGAKTAGKPKAGESARMKAKRKSFKARHRKNIKRGNMSAAYWADKVKW